MKKELFSSRLFVISLAISMFFCISCSETFHKNGKMLFYTSEKDSMYVIYQKDMQNYLFASTLLPFSEKWERNISGHPGTPVVKIFGDLLACNCRKDFVCLLDRETGKTVFETASKLVFSPDAKGFTVENGSVYTLCGENSICAFDIESGEKIWETAMNAEEIPAAEFKIEENLFFYGTEISGITAINLSDGKVLWKTDPLENLNDFHTFPETLLADYDFIDGFDISNGESEWLQPYAGKVRCINDGFVIAQSEEFFSVLFVKNGQEYWNYPRTGTTILSCNEEVSLAAFTVRNLEPQESETAENYFDKVYIFDISTGERIFEHTSDINTKVINITGFSGSTFYIATEIGEPENMTVIIEKYSTNSLEKELSFSFPKGTDEPEIFITLVHRDAEHTVFKKTNILTPSDISFYLFETESGKLLGKMTGFPEVVYGGKAVDIIDYDDYFNIKEKTLTDFLEKE
ncbi:PQQ-binding-like beta-propeller repeat protein [bacterium]|nr:PQQ-binding-like beta-propeller repeat protein [bacterium]